MPKRSTWQEDPAAPISAQAWHALDISAVATALETDLHRGLSHETAAARRDSLGPNELGQEKRRGLGRMLADQFRDVVVWVLLAATLVAALTGETIDAVVILAIVVLNAVLGVIQESKAEQALAALKRMAAPTARVVRAGEIRNIPARELVPGDLLLLEAGNYVSADARLIETVNLQVEEASLTGESVPVEKDADLFLAEDVPLEDRLNMVFSGTSVTRGRARAVVTATGMDSQLGQIARMLEEIETEKTPLQERLEDLGRWLAAVVLAICVVVFLAGILRQVPPLTMFLMAVSLAVAAIPEGLPAVVTIVLALGMQNMVRRHVIIRKLRAVEALGSTGVICTDKTGTLTQNEMTVRRYWVNGHTGTVTGAGYTPLGEFSHHGETVSVQDEPDLRLLLEIACLCNDAALTERDGHWEIRGDPTEAALLVATAKTGLWREDLEQRYPRALEVPFDADRKRMSTIHRTEGGYRLLVKGAPDVMLPLCSHIRRQGQEVPLDEETAEHLRHVYQNFADQALRVLAFAYRNLPELPRDLTPAVVEKNLTFGGLMGLIDLPRSEVKPAVAICRAAGIRPVMVTGDHVATAMAIARELEMVGPGDTALTGQDLRRMSDAELDAQIDHVAVFARVSPADKLRIVRSHQRRGHVVSMTGDGVNDAPAVKRADIGVAMGIAGTDVAKGAADMVLTDDNFASIVAAVEEGRGIFDNIRKFVYYLLSCNISEVLTIFLSILAGLQHPLLPKQILWINLVTDGLPALALGVDPKEPAVMHRPPRNPQEGILDRRTITHIFLYGGVITVATLAAFVHAFTWDVLVPLGIQSPGAALAAIQHPEFWRQPIVEQGMKTARTMTFATLALSQLAHSLNCRSDRHSLFQLGVFTNTRLLLAIASSVLAQMAVLYLPLGQRIFATVTLDAEDLLIVGALSLSPLLFGELYKWLVHRRRNVQHGMRNTE